VDLFGPLVTKDDTGKRKKYVMVMTDAFTKMAILRVIPNKTAQITAETFLNTWVYTFGVPRIVVTDQGNEFKGLFDACIRVTLQSQHISTTPYHPQSNGQAEVFNRTLAHYLRTMIEDCDKDTLQWEAYIMPLQFSYNTAIHKTIMTTPFYAQFGYDPNVPLWQRKDKSPLLDDAQKFTDPVARIIQVNKKVHDHIRQRMPKVQARQDAQYNKRHDTQAHTFNVGDRVWVERMGITEANPKLMQKWEEAVILHFPTESTVKIARYNRSSRKQIVVHLDKIRHMHSPDPPPDTPHNPHTNTVATVDPADAHILQRLYTGCASTEDLDFLLRKGYVIVFPQGTLTPTTLMGYQMPSLA